MRVREIDISYPSYPDPFLGGQVTSPPPSITRVATVARSPYLIQASAAVEEEISRGTWLSLDYSFLHGARLFRLVDVIPSRTCSDPDLSRRIGKALSRLRAICLFQVHQRRIE